MDVVRLCVRRTGSGSAQGAPWLQSSRNSTHHHSTHHHSTHHHSSSPQNPQMAQGQARELCQDRPSCFLQGSTVGAPCAVLLTTHLPNTLLSAPTSTSQAPAQTGSQGSISGSPSRSRSSGQRCSCSQSAPALHRAHRRWDRPGAPTCKAGCPRSQGTPRPVEGRCVRSCHGFLARARAALLCYEPLLLREGTCCPQAQTVVRRMPG